MKRCLSLFTFLIIFLSTVFCQSFEIYVSDAGGFNNPPWQVAKFDENGEHPETFNDEDLAWPQDIVFLEDQEVVLISSLSSNRITKHNIDDGTYLEDFATGIGGPTRMKIGADGLLYVLQWGGNGLVKRYQLDGTFIDDFTDVGVVQSIGLDWDSDGNLYVSSYGGSFIRKFDTEGNDQGIFINTSLSGPTNIWFNEVGELLALNWNGSTASRFDANGVFIDNFITGLSNPEGVAILPNGNILIGDGGTSSVKLFDADGNYIEDLIESGVGGLIFPNAVVIRIISPLSIASPSKENSFIQPTLGTDFFIHDQKIKSISVYDLSGRLLEKKEINTDRYWQAGNYSEGLYIVLGELKDGNQVSQKIVMKK